MGGQAGFEMANCLLNFYAHCKLKQITTHNVKTFKRHTDTHGTAHPAKGARYQYGMFIVPRQSKATLLSANKVELVSSFNKTLLRLCVYLSNSHIKAAISGQHFYGDSSI